MREVKFRGQDCFGNWQFGSLVTDNQTFWFIRNSVCDVSVDPKTVGQYTGFKTQNQSLVYDESKELFEGDIFRPKNLDAKYLIVFENGRWIGESTDGDEWGRFTCEIGNVRKDIILTGNIHDNPEFL